jgi:hypothetical protein
MLIAEDAVRLDREVVATESSTDGNDETNDRIDVACKRQELSISQTADDVIESGLHHQPCPRNFRVRNCSEECSATGRLSFSSSSSACFSVTEIDRARRCEFQNNFTQLHQMLADCDVHSQLLAQESFRNDDDNAFRRRTASCPCLSAATDAVCQPANCRRHRVPEDAAGQTGELERLWPEAADRRHLHDSCQHHRRPQQQQQQPVLGQVPQLYSDSQVFGTLAEAMEHSSVGTLPEAVDAVTVAVESLQASSCGTPARVWNDGRPRNIEERSPQRRLEVRRRSRSPQRRAMFVTQPVGILAVLCMVIALVSIVAGIGICTGNVDSSLGYVLIGKLSSGQCMRVFRLINTFEIQCTHLACVLYFVCRLRPLSLCPGPWQPYYTATDVKPNKLQTKVDFVLVLRT